MVEDVGGAGGSRLGGMTRSEDAVEPALRALRYRDRSAAELDARLERRGVGEAEREQALETLERIGYVDDERFARTRAEQLADRGSGDALIRHDLEGRGLAAELVEAALAALEPERERAAGSWSGAAAASRPRATSPRAGSARTRSRGSLRRRTEKR